MRRDDKRPIRHTQMQCGSRDGASGHMVTRLAPASAQTAPMPPETPSPAKGKQDRPGMPPVRVALS